MIYETNYLTTSQYPNYFDPYWQHPYPHKISFHTMDNVKLRESFVHPVSGKHRYEHPIMRRKFESRGNSRYNDRHYYGEGSPYLFSEEEAEEGEYDPHSSNHYGSRKFYHSDQYPEMTRLASIPHIRQTREMQQVSRLHHKSKDDAVPWPQSAVYVTQPMMLVDPVLTQPHYQQHQQQILGICTTDLMPGRLLSPPQMPMTAASPLSKPGNNNLVVPPISHLQNVSVIHPLHSAHHIQNQPCFLNMTSNQPTSFPAFPQQFFTSPSLNLLQQPQQELTLPSAFLNPTNFLGLPQASVIEKKTDNSSKPNTSNEQTPVEGLHSSTSPSAFRDGKYSLFNVSFTAWPFVKPQQLRRLSGGYITGTASNKSCCYCINFMY
ncbi:hypothetical protein BDF20DRAFT_280135 [Mycotypha africana]|uniref:uncharacterized protein n=1 Tax=Mycotypha africana TaxID=64632 RepID=UPI0023001CDC|nr:uncharacterized protein BDF20DRAFT_280135 [Mycotypha africana]KAI8987636.1 hypothetical protein BDF20DRAFT_280135 [Mycotypha africana]